MVEIRTERLLLRRAMMDDLPEIHAIMSNADVMRHWSTLPHDSIDQSADWLRSMVEADTMDSDDYVIERDGRVIGKIGCWKLPEIGFYLAPDHWGQGFASEAMTAYVDRRRALGEPKVLIADVDPNNGPSLNLLTRHGFVETGRATGTWIVGGEAYDSVYLALTL